MDFKPYETELHHFVIKDAVAEIPYDFCLKVLKADKTVVKAINPAKKKLEGLTLKQAIETEINYNYNGKIC